MKLSAAEACLTGAWEVEMRIVVAATFAALLSIALAITLPPDASMFVTDDDGVIVGVGRSHAGETFFLDVIASYQGFARLVVVTSHGEVEVHDVVVTHGTVLIELVDLRDIATRSGFAEVVVEAIDVVDAAYALHPTFPGSAREGTPGMSRADADDAPPQPSVGTADDAPRDAPSAAPAPGVSPPTPPSPPSPPSPPVGDPTGPPASPPEPPVVPEPPVEPEPPRVPGPPASTPGLPSGPPAHGPGGSPGGGPHGPDAPGAEDEDAGEPSDDERRVPPGQNRRP